MARSARIFLATVATCSALCAWGASRPALANGRLPAGHQLVVAPNDPSLFVVETAFGVLVSHDTGATWGWICEQAIGYDIEGGTEDPTMGLTSQRILAGLSEGLASSVDNGCSWGFTLNDPIVDLVVRRDNPHAALVVSSKYAGVGDAGQNLYFSRVLATSDDGAHWAQQGTVLDSAIVIETIDVAASDPLRLYLSGTRRQSLPDGGIQSVGVVLASTDGGHTYVQTLVPPDAMGETDGVPFIAAVDPADPNRVYARVRTAAADRLIVSEDGAATFRTIFPGQSYLGGFALSSDGTKIYLGGTVDGMQLARTSAVGATPAFQFTQQSAAPVECLTLSGATLYACMSAPEGFYLQQIGASTDDGVTFRSVFQFACLQTALACPGCGIAAQCAPALPGLLPTLGTCDTEGGALSPPNDAGCTDAGNGPTGAGVGRSLDAAPDAPSNLADAGSTAPGSPPSGHCGCDEGEAGAGSLSALLVLATTVLRRSRRRRTSL